MKTFTERMNSISPRQIIKRVADYYHVTAGQLSGQKRTRHIARARHVAIHLVREQFDEMSLHGIGSYFQDRDHATIIYALRDVSRRIATDPEYAAEVLLLSRSLLEVEETALVDV